METEQFHEESFDMWGTWNTNRQWQGTVKLEAASDGLRIDFYVVLWEQWLYHLPVISVHFSSRWDLDSQKSPYSCGPVSEKFPQSCFWNGSSVHPNDSGPLSSFRRMIVECFLFPCLSPPGVRGYDVLGFVPGGSGSSSSIHWIFRHANHLW